MSPRDRGASIIQVHPALEKQQVAEQILAQFDTQLSWST
ncbi:hypothetical protein EMIT0P258_90017 [Pseudomonas sp. IT-P258]